LETKKTPSMMIEEVDNKIRRISKNLGRLD